MAALVKDVVCGMEIDPGSAEASSVHNGVTYYFCAESCKQEFDADPAKFLGATSASSGSGGKRWWEFWKS
jgi:YHS domain-containing protein